MEVAAEQVQRLEDQPQFYAQHLGEVNATHEVVSLEDIYNDRGLLIARKGTQINPALSQKILQHKLVKPLHSQVDIVNGLTQSGLREGFDALFERFPDLVTLTERLGLWEEFEGLVGGLPLPRLLLQNLTVLRERMPAVYERALFAALLALLIARVQGESPVDARAAYIAGLVHDIGLLHIDPAIVERYEQRAQLSAEEWRAIHSHVVVSRMIVEEVGNAVPPLTALAVVEHHERCDGSGYPGGYGGAQLHVLGQVVAMGESLYGARASLPADPALNMANLVPFLQLNSHVHSKRVYRTVRSMLRRSRLRPGPLGGSPAKQIELLVRQAGVLAEVLPTLDEVETLAAEQRLPRRFYCLPRVAGRLMRSAHACGAGHEALGPALAQGDDEGLARDLDDLELLQQELAVQLAQVRNLLRDYLQQAEEAPPQLQAAHERLEAALQALQQAA